MVKWLRHRPFTAVTWVQVPYGSPRQRSPPKAGFFVVVTSRRFAARKSPLRSNLREGTPIPSRAHPHARRGLRPSITAGASRNDTGVVPYEGRDGGRACECGGESRVFAFCRAGAHLRVRPPTTANRPRGSYFCHPERSEGSFLTAALFAREGSFAALRMTAHGES